MRVNATVMSVRPRIPTVPGAWIFTGGSDAGVMKMVGAAMREKGTGDIPLIGIGPWGAVMSRTDMSHAKGARVNYRPAGKAHKDAAPLKCVEARSNSPRGIALCSSAHRSPHHAAQPWALPSPHTHAAAFPSTQLGTHAFSAGGLG